MTARCRTLVLLLPLAACGCSSLGMSRLYPFAAEEPPKADAKNPAFEVACMWQPGEGRNPKGIPCRGFSGQIFFFTRTSAEPVVVDGAIRIYLFADRGTPEERSKPIHQYDFTPEVWAGHLAQTSLGSGYTVFVPYPDQDPYQTRCHLRVRFQPRQGPAIYSDSVTLTLEGPPRPGETGLPPAPTVENAELVRRQGTLRQLNGAPTAAADAASRQLKTQTFRLDGRGGILPASHETPAPSKAAPASFAPEPAQPLVPPTPHPLSAGADAFAPPPSTDHPLTLAAATPVAAGHPLAGATPVGRSVPVASAEPASARRVRLSSRNVPAATVPAEAATAPAVARNGTATGVLDPGGWQPLDGPN